MQIQLSDRELANKSKAENSNPYTSMNKVKEFLKLSQEILSQDSKLFRARRGTSHL